MAEKNTRDSRDKRMGKAKQRFANSSGKGRCPQRRGRFEGKHRHHKP